MPSPIVHTLLPTCMMVTAGLPGTLPRPQRWWLVSIAIFLGNSPDFDLLPALFDDRLWTHVHRWYGHNIFSLVALMFLGRWLLGRFAPSLPKKVAWWTSILIVASHPVLDGMVHPQMVESGVPLLFPFSYRTFHMPYWLFSRSYHADGHHRLMGYAISTENWETVFRYEVAMVGNLLVLMFCTKRLLTLVRSRRANPSSQSSPQCTPAPPSLLRPDGSPSRTYTDS